MRVSIKRSPGGEAREYEIGARKGESVLNVLERIYETCDATIAFDSACGVGKCGVCRMRINGRDGLACTEPAEDGLVLEATPKGRFVKDLLMVMDETGEDPMHVQ